MKKTADLAIRAEGLTKTYAPARRGGVSRTAVDALSLEVRQGDVFGFLGANGAGKTTTVKMLLGFHVPTAGSGFLFDTPINDHRARLAVGYLPEQPYFPRFLTAGETVRMHARLAGLGRRESRSATSCLDRVGMASHERTPLAKLSKGMTQRVALAAALVADPQLLILDEPASGLDPIGRREMIAVLRELAAEGRTIFLSSHFLNEVENLCTRVAILRAGRLVAEGAPGEIVRQETRVAVTARDVSPEAVVSALRELGPGVEALPDPAGTQLRLVVPEDRIYPALSLLERFRATLVSVAPSRETLEAAFFRLAQGAPVAQDTATDFVMEEAA